MIVSIYNNYPFIDRLSMSIMIFDS